MAESLFGKQRYLPSHSCLPFGTSSFRPPTRFIVYGRSRIHLYFNDLRLYQEKWALKMPDIPIGGIRL